MREQTIPQGALGTLMTNQVVSFQGYTPWMPTALLEKAIQEDRSKMRVSRTVNKFAVETLRAAPTFSRWDPTSRIQVVFFGTFDRDKGWTLKNPCPSLSDDPESLGFVIFDGQHRTSAAALNFHASIPGWDFLSVDLFISEESKMDQVMMLSNSK